MFRKSLLWVGLSIVVMIGCSEDANTPVAPGFGRVTFSVPGIVQEFYLRGVLAPFSLEKGEPIELVVSYDLKSDSERCSGTVCDFSGFNNSWLTVNTQSQSWTVPIVRISLGEGPDFDQVSMNGATMSPTRFPAHLEQSVISAYLDDSDPPYDMLSGPKLQGLNLAGVINGRVSIRSSSSSSATNWMIVCLLSTEPVAH